MTEDCPHDKIKVLRLEEGWQWSCARCGDKMATWPDMIFEKVIGDDYREVKVGEGFTFNVVVKDEDMQGM